MKPELLNLGCGNHFHIDWYNVDFHSTSPQVIVHDLTTGLPFKEPTFDAVYSSHLLEHFARKEAPRFLNACFEVLKPGGIIRIVVPDLEMIVRTYLEILDQALQGDEEARKRYDWILIELFDQMVRNHPGGEMLNYWKRNPMPAESFVIERQGSEVRNFIEAYRKASQSPLPPDNHTLSREEIGWFRTSGEIHQWMYDRYSIGRLLTESGFSEVNVCKADESGIPNFNNYLLDIENDGSVRKPDSLFMEAVKRVEKRKQPSRSSNLRSYQNLSDNLLRIVSEKQGKIEKHSERNVTYHKPLKIVHLCMQDFGGAGKAAYRLHNGQQSIGMDSTMLVLNKRSVDTSVKVIPEVTSGKMSTSLDVSTFNSPLWNSQVQSWLKMVSAYPNRPGGLEMFTDAESGVRLDLIHEIQAADIVNLHWVAGVFDYTNAPVALKHKQIVWTLHDMNPFTGGCHYAGDCQKYKSVCSACPQLGSSEEYDLSRQVWAQKKYAYQDLDIQIVTPSQWLGKCAAESELFGRFPVRVIPYGFPLDTFKPFPKAQIRIATNISKHAKVILFGADSVTNQRKGFLYLLEALNRFPLSGNDEVVLLTFGAIPSDVKIPSKYQVLNAGKIGDENQLAQLYSAADLFVLPSLEDNLPNTVIEAMACGLPVVAFDIGGVPDMVAHKRTGYLARPKDVADLAQGINWVLNQCEKDQRFSKACRRRVVEHYALDIQARKYKELYSQLL